LWKSVLADYELSEPELCLLREAVHVADVCHELQGLVDRDGPMPEGRVSAALVELRQERILLARLTVALRVPIGEAGDGHPAGRSQSQYRGTRGVYAVRGGAS